jgi:diacylglycerol kinase (ATP)
MAEPNRPDPRGPAPPSDRVSAYKSRNGLQRILRAAGYSWAGLVAAFRHEAAFRQELLLGLPLVVAAWWVGETPLQVVALVAVVVLVWIVELLNSAIEALADGVTIETHPMMGRAKDLGSAAVMLSLILVLLTWGAVIWGRMA